MSDRGKVAIIILNYNMKQIVSSHVTAIENRFKELNDIFVVDNGSSSAYRYTGSRDNVIMLSLKHNVRTMHGFLMGIAYAKAYQLTRPNTHYSAYWFLTTSAELMPEGDDILLKAMTQMRRNDTKIGCISPAWAATPGHSETHDAFIGRGTNTLRRTWIGGFLSIWKADPFNEYLRKMTQSIHIPDLNYLTHSWGADYALSAYFRAQGYGLYVDERFSQQLHVAENIGYTLGRMEMTANKRAGQARAEMKTILGDASGDQDWLKYFKHGIKEQWL